MHPIVCGSPRNIAPKRAVSANKRLGILPDCADESSWDEARSRVDDEVEKLNRTTDLFEMFCDA